MTDEPTNEPEVTTPARSRGRPSLAEMEAREKALADKEAELALREREADLKAAEANAALREVDVIRTEQAIAASSPARSGTIRNETARSANVTEPLRRRRYHGGEMPTEFHIPEEQIPLNTSYQWNNDTVFGQTNPSYSSHAQMQGWRAVDASRHPHLMPEGYTGPIKVKGQILMERPMELTLEARQEDYERAIGEVQRKEEQLYGAPAGTLPRARANGSQDFIQVNREVVPGAPTKTNYQYDNAGPVIE